MKKLSKTAILIFALSAKEAKKRNYVISHGGISQKLTDNTLKKVQATGIDYLIFTEKEQQGNNFGERFTNALKKAFDLGYEKVISIGNDTPQLSVKHLKKAHSLLQQNKPIIGPSFDGGFYLLAINKKQFNETAFKAFKWQTNTVFKEVYKFISTTLSQQNLPESIHVLPLYYDLDGLTQVKKVLALLGSSCKELSTLLQQLLAVNKLAFQKLFFLKEDIVLQLPFNKGSPLF